MKLNWKNLFSFFRKKEVEEIQKESTQESTQEDMMELYTAREIFLDDTVEFYSHDTRRRCIVPSQEDGVVTCSYRFKKKRCAIGRHIPDSLYSPEIEGDGVGNDSVLHCLPEVIKSLGVNFLQQVQNLHDSHANWNKRKGLTKQGKERLRKLKEEFINEPKKRLEDSVWIKS